MSESHLASSRHRQILLGYASDEILNVPHGLRDAGGQTIRLDSLETSHSLLYVAAKSPHANHHFEFRE
jgi:hypothetical protein